MRLKRVLLALTAVCLLAGAAAAAPKKPKLVLAIAIDQFRYDYLTRFRADYKAGFNRILERGAVFTNAHYIQIPTVTAVGHSTFLSGATPSVSGIVANEWYERETGKSVTSVSDAAVQLLGGGAGRTGSSPRRLLVSTVGDELKMGGKSAKVIGISIKDRSAILPAGHMADGAYWFDDTTGNWVSSAYYFADLPAWVKHVNQGRPADKYLGAEWMGKKMSAAAGASLYKSLEATPFGNELIESMAERCITAEQLGKHGGVDVLAISFSANDYIGHAVGPDAPEVRDISIRTDRLLGKLLDYIDAQIGPDNTLFVMTADHGVAPVPEVNAARKMPGGRLSPKTLAETVEASLSQKFGPGKWVVSGAGSMYLNRQLIHEKNLDEAAVERVAAEALRGVAHVARVYTRDQLINGSAQPDAIGRAMNYGFYGPRSGDLFLVPDSYWFIAESASGTTHGTPFDYDTHVPIVFMGPGIRAGKYNRNVAVNDIAPTLATILEIETPSGSVGSVLEELFGLAANERK